MLCMPIRDNYANVVAVVQAINKLDGVFTMTDELLLTSVAIQVCACVCGDGWMGGLPQRDDEMRDQYQ